MANEEHHQRVVEDEQFRLAFVEDTGISEQLRNEIIAIRSNNPDVTKFGVNNLLVHARTGVPVSEAFVNLSDLLAWELIGRYITNNTHLKQIGLVYCDMTDSKISSLFRGLTKSCSVKQLLLTKNDFGIEGIRSMVPFLQNSPNLSKLDLTGNRNITTGVFELLVNALNGRPIENLQLRRCKIDNISALENCALPCLRELSLQKNNIQNMGSAFALENYTSLGELYLSSTYFGIDGCRTIANLLRKKGCSLDTLYLTHADINDEGIEILANSLRHNTSLKILSLESNSFQERGYRALLKLLMDVSSIESTYKSNHTLQTLYLPYLLQGNSTSPTIKGLRSYIRGAVAINERNPNPGKNKVIHYQFNSIRRTEIARLQGIDRSHNCLLLSEMDNALVLPELLSIVGNNHDHGELYEMLKAAVPDLASIVNRAAILKEKMEENLAQIATLKAECDCKVAALNAKNLEFEKVVELIHSRKRKK